jgi:hypothetical protein
VHNPTCNGQFALMHDLTNCLRIGDVSVFTDEGPEQIEVKTNAKRHNSAQNRKLRAARNALGRAGPLPGEDRGEGLYDLDLPYRTHLDLLRTGTERAARDGIFAARARGNRALLVSDLYGCQARGWTEDQFNDQLARKFSGALRRAGLGPRLVSNVHATSLDSVSRDPLRVPFAAYPLDPVACARLIGDIAVLETSGPALAASVSDAGIPARWVWGRNRRDTPWRGRNGDDQQEVVARARDAVPGTLQDPADAPPRTRPLPDRTGRAEDVDRRYQVHVGGPRHSPKTLSVRRSIKKGRATLKSLPKRLHGGRLARTILLFLGRLDTTPFPQPTDASAERSEEDGEGISWPLAAGTR